LCAQADARDGAQVPDRYAKAAVRGGDSFASQVLDRFARPLPAAPLVVRRICIIVMPRPLPAAALVMYHRVLFIYRAAKSVARGGACCGAQIAAAAATLPQQEKKNSADVQRK
jgi:hypothetical protein